MSSRTRIQSIEIPSGEDSRFANTANTIDVDTNPTPKDRGSAASLDQQMDVSLGGAQTGGTRSSKHVRSAGHPHNVEPAPAAFEGSIKSRVFDDPTRQGISSRSSQAELPGQQKVTSARTDALAGLDHSSRNEGRHADKSSSGTTKEVANPPHTQQEQQFAVVSAVRHVGPTLESDPDYVELPSSGYPTPEAQIAAEAATAEPDIRGVVDDGFDPISGRKREGAEAEPLKTRLPGDTSSDPHTDVGPKAPTTVESRRKKTNRVA